LRIDGLLIGEQIMTLAVNIAQSGSNNVTMRNRIINGAMAIAQRSTSSLTVNTSSSDVYPVDRFNGFVDASSGVFTVQQSSDVPTGSGFRNSVVLTVTTADASLATGDLCAFRQIIEGFNIYDLGWGTANAQPVTLSFWAKSSITGTHSGTFTNGDWNRTYAFTYTLSAANTWQYITITAPGAPSGTWGNGNGRGIQVVFNVGASSANLGTANTWSTTSAVTVGATGSVQLISTLGATLFITGVQFEEGTAASPFEYRSYGQELALCQRYFQTYGNRYQGSSYTSLTVAPMGWAQSGTNSRNPLTFVVPMRSAPTASYLNIEVWDTLDGSAYAVTGIGNSFTTLYQTLLSLDVASGLTARRPYWAKTQGNGNPGSIDLSAEL
jgi:hypothetical protein